MKIEDVDKDYAFWNHTCEIVRKLEPFLDEYDIEELSVIGATLKGCISKIQNYVDIYNENVCEDYIIRMPKEYFTGEDEAT